MIDLSTLSLEELKELRRDIANALEGFNSNRKRMAMKEIRAVAKKYGYSIKDLFGDRVLAKPPEKP